MEAKTPKLKGHVPGLRNNPLALAKQGTQNRDLIEEQKIDQKWFKHFFDDLGTLAQIEDRKSKQKRKFEDQYKLMKQKTGFFRGKQKAEIDGFAL